MRTDDLALKLGRTLDSIPFCRFHVWVIVVLSLVGFTEGYDLALTGSLLVLAKAPLHMTVTEVRWLVVGPAATLCAAMLAGSPFFDRAPRKTILQIGLVISTSFTLAIPLVHTAAQLIVLRLIASTGFGLALPGAYPLGTELLPARHRRTFGVVFEVVLASAFTTIPLMGYLVGQSGWRLVALPGGFMLFFLPLLVHYVVPESPRWYLSRNDARTAIRETNRIIVRAGAAVPLLAEAEAAGSIERTATPSRPYSTLFAGRQLRPTLVAMLTWLPANSCYFLFAFLLPKALVDQGYAVPMSFGLSTLLFSASIPGKILDGVLMERIGRRLTIFFTFAISIAGLLLMVVAHRVTGTIAGVAGATLVFTLGAIITGLTVLSSFPAVRVYMTEQFPTDIRGRGYFLSELVGRFTGGVVVPYFIAGDTGSPSIFFGTAIAFMTVGAFVPILLGRETIGQLETVTFRGEPSAVIERGRRASHS